MSQKIRVIHSADLHLGVETYGRINPSTGLSSRFSDFLAALDELVDYAIQSQIDLVLLCGDVYKNRSPSQTQQREFARRINRLATNDIAVFLLVGNHDLPNAIGRAISTEIFDTLAIKNVFVSSRPEIINIATPHGVIQVASLPWLRRSALLAQLSKEDISGLNFDELNKRLEKILTTVINQHVESLDPEIPAILVAHIWVAGSKLGSERGITIGQEQTLLLGNVANIAFDYVALGHIHKHQVLSKNPPVVYSGSLERLDFGESNDDKGFYVVELESGGQISQRQTSFAFHPVKGRPFVTISVNLEKDEAFPTDVVLKSVAKQSSKLKDAIVRLQISLPLELEGQLSDVAIKESLKEAHHITIAKDIKRKMRLRLSGHNAEEITPLEALGTYVEQKKHSARHSKLLLQHGRRLLQEIENAEG